MSYWANKIHMTKKTLKRPLMHNSPLCNAHAASSPVFLTKGELSLPEIADAELFREIDGIFIDSINKFNLAFT